MKLHVLIGFNIETSNYTDVKTVAQAKKLVAAMFAREADFPDADDIFVGVTASPNATLTHSSGTSFLLKKDCRGRRVRVY
jgi:hypothetical protein